MIVKDAEQEVNLLKKHLIDKLSHRSRLREKIATIEWADFWMYTNVAERKCNECHHLQFLLLCHFTIPPFCYLVSHTIENLKNGKLCFSTCPTFSSQLSAHGWQSSLEKYLTWQWKVALFLYHRISILNSQLSTLCCISNLTSHWLPVYVSRISHLFQLNFQSFGNCTVKFKLCELHWKSGLCFTDK